MTGGSILLSEWFLDLLWVVAAVPIVAMLAFEVRRCVHSAPTGSRTSRSGRWALRGIAVLVSLVVSILAAADAVNRHFDYVPSFSALLDSGSRDLVHRPIVTGSGRSLISRMPSHGLVEHVALDGPLSHVHGRDAYIYLPPQYFDPARPGERFPVLYMLHGSPGVAVDWLRGGHLDVAMDELVASGRIRPFIVVMPDVNGGYLNDTECADVPGGPRVQTYLTVDVVHDVDRQFRTIPHRLDRAIGGLSTGGYCATNLTLRHQDIFSASISHSGNLRPEQNFVTGSLFSSRADAVGNTPADYLPTIPITAPLAMYFDSGSQDGYARGPSIYAARTLRARGVPTELNIFPGYGHGFGTWSHALSFSLPWLSRWFAHWLLVTAPMNGHPSRQPPSVRVAAVETRATTR